MRNYSTHKLKSIVEEKDVRTINLLMVGSDSTVRGGISSVIKQMLDYNWPNDMKIYFVPTHIEGSRIKKFYYYLNSLFKILYYYLFKKIDIIHIHLSYNGSFFRKYILFLLSKIIKVRVIIHLHGSEFQQFYERSNNVVKKLIQHLFKGSNVTLVLGEEWNARIKKIEPTTNTLILRNAVSIPPCIVENNKKEFKILFLGTLIERKGIFDLLIAMKELNEKQVLSQYNVQLIIGGVGKEEEKIKKYINEHDLCEYINLVGWVDGEKKKKLLEESQLLILPSYNEGLPIAILEGISYGLPIIATNVGSISEAIIDYHNGFLIQPGNPLDIEKSIINIISNLDLWRKMSFNSKKLALEKFDEKIFFIELRKLYVSLVQSDSI